MSSRTLPQQSTCRTNCRKLEVAPRSERRVAYIFEVTHLNRRLIGSPRAPYFTESKQEDTFTQEVFPHLRHQLHCGKLDVAVHTTFRTRRQKSVFPVSVYLRWRLHCEC